MDVYNDLGTVGLSIGWDSNGDPYLTVAKVNAGGVVSKAYKLTYDGVTQASASFTSDRFTSKLFNSAGASAQRVHNNTGASTYYNYTAAKNTVTGAYSNESPSGGASSDSWATARSRQNNKWFATDSLSYVLGGSGDSYRIPDGYYIDSDGSYNSSTDVYSRALFYASYGNMSQVGTVYYKNSTSGVGLWCDADGSNGTQSFNLDRYLTLPGDFDRFA